MKGLWKTYLDDNVSIKKTNIKKTKYKHLKKDNFAVLFKKTFVSEPLPNQNNHKKISLKLKKSFDGKHFYGKQISTKDVNKLMWIATPRKKIFKKISSAKNRRILRDWLKKEEYESEIPTHYISKSIRRELH